MSSVFELYSNNKLSVSDEIPCLYVIEKRKIGNYDTLYSSSDNYTHVLYRIPDSKVYLVGFDLNQLSNGESYMIDTHEADGKNPFAYVSVYGKFDRVKNVDLYFFGIKKMTTASLAGMELYGDDGYVLFTSRKGTRYPKVLKASTASTDSFTITTNPAIFIVNSDDVVADKDTPSRIGGGSERRLPLIAKNGSSVTVTKQLTNRFHGSYVNTLNMYSWMLVTLKTVE